MLTKEHILAEIRRVAQASDGTPPGIKTFEQLTGISEHEWAGRLWARWSDAVKEAGFEPNVLQGAYPDDMALDQLIELVEDLGAFPTHRELQLAHRTRSGFPSTRVYRRIGRKAQLARKAASRCEQVGRTGLVLDLCRAAALQTPRRKSPADTPEVGEVYLLKSGRYFKIGRSNSTGRREYELATHRPEGLTRVHVIRTDDPSGVEADWHRRFADRRQAGEWFDLSASDVAAFKRWKRIM